MPLFQRLMFPHYPQDIDHHIFVLNGYFTASPWHIIHILDRIDRVQPSIIGSYKLIMAKKTRFSDDFKFINCVLTPEQGVEFTAWYKSKERHAEAAFDQIFADQYKVAFSWDDKNQCFIASMVAKSDESENANKSLTARSDNWLEAMAMVAFKHTVIFKSGEWHESAGSKAWG